MQQSEQRFALYRLLGVAVIIGYAGLATGMGEAQVSLTSAPWLVVWACAVWAAACAAMWWRHKGKPAWAAVYLMASGDYALLALLLAAWPEVMLPVVGIMPMVAVRYGIAHGERMIAWCIVLSVLGLAIVSGSGLLERDWPMFAATVVACGLLPVYVFALMRKLRDAEVAAQEANAHKSIFLATMSHELRTPLNAILGATELLADAQGEKRREYSEIISANAKQLYNTIDEVLDISAIEFGELDAWQVRFSLEALASELRQVVEPLAEEKALALDFTISEDLPRSVLGDRKKISQIIVNLVENAIKHTQRGYVRMALLGKPLSDGEGTGGWILRIEVRDTGPGIADADKQVIFERFRQLSSGTRRAHTGAGLGLSIVDGFARALGGVAEVHDNPGGGALFVVSVPVIEATGIEPEAASEGDDAVSRYVLVVDDSYANRQVLGGMLRAGGHRVVEAGGGAEACRLIAQERFDVIVTDLNMPEVSGIEVVKAAHARKARPGVVMVSADPTPETIRECMDLGADEFLSKPVSKRVLLQSVRRVSARQAGAVGTL